MKKDYVITNQELAEKGLDLNDYALTGELIPAIIQIGLDIAITRCCFLNDNFKGEKSIEEALDNNTDLVDTFKKLQRKILWNLIFAGTDDPVDQYIDDIISHELGWGKINGYQKGLWYKNY
jgi:hypothetical protein